MKYPVFIERLAKQLAASGGMHALMEHPMPLSEKLRARPEPGTDLHALHEALVRAVLQRAYRGGWLRADDVASFMTVGKGPKRRRGPRSTSPWLTGLASVMQEEMERTAAAFGQALSVWASSLSEFPSVAVMREELGYDGAVLPPVVPALERILEPVRQAAWAAQASLSQLPLATYAAMLYAHLAQVAESTSMSKEAHRRVHVVAASVALAVAFSRCLNLKVPGLAGVMVARAELRDATSAALQVALAPLPLRTFLATRVRAFVRAERFMFLAACHELVHFGTMNGLIEGYRLIAPEAPPSCMRLAPAFELTMAGVDGIDPLLPPLVVAGAAQRRWLEEHRGVPMLPTVEQGHADVAAEEVFLSDVRRFFSHGVAWSSLPPAPWRRVGVLWSDADGKPVRDPAMRLLAWLDARALPMPPAPPVSPGELVGQMHAWRTQLALREQQARDAALREEVDSRLAALRAYPDAETQRIMLRELHEDLHQRGVLALFHDQLAAEQRRISDMEAGRYTDVTPDLSGVGHEYAASAAPVAAERPYGLAKGGDTGAPLARVSGDENTSDDHAMQELLDRFRNYQNERDARWRTDAATVSRSSVERDTDVTPDLSDGVASDLSDDMEMGVEEWRAYIREQIEGIVRDARNMQDADDAPGMQDADDVPGMQHADDAPGMQDADDAPGVLNVPPMPAYLRR